LLTPLLRLLSSSPPLQNVLISPISIYLALALLHRGAGGITRRELNTVLGVNEQSASELMDSARSLLLTYLSLRQKLKTDIALANAIFSDDSFIIEDDYRADLQEKFLSDIRTVDFDEAYESASAINSWVSNKTRGLIEDLVPPTSVDADTRLMLLNAVYFKANWMRKFEARNTRKRSFYLNNERTLEVEADMMGIEGVFRVGEDKIINADMISLQYENPDFTMLVFLPQPTHSLDSLISSLMTTNTSLSLLHSSLQPRHTVVSLPKFSLSHSANLVPVLSSSLGVSSLFSPTTANLSSLSLSEAELYVTDILHQATVEVSEEGSEAAAATAVSIATRGGFSDQDTFIVDRPFLFIILDLVNNIPLFMGKVVNPTGEKTPGPSEELIGVRTTGEEKTTNICLEEPGLCKNGGTCAASAQDPRDFICACRPRFTGSQCQDTITPQNKTQTSFDTRSSALKDASFDPDNCVPGHNITEYQEEGEQKVVRFPCPHQLDTQPIRDYIEKHGDPSRLGVRGELANNLS